MEKKKNGAPTGRKKMFSQIDFGLDYLYIILYGIRRSEHSVGWTRNYSRCDVTLWKHPTLIPYKVRTAFSNSSTIATLRDGSTFVKIPPNTTHHLLPDPHCPISHFKYLLPDIYIYVERESRERHAFYITHFAVQVCHPNRVKVV